MATSGTLDFGKSLCVLMLVKIENRRGLLIGLDGCRTEIDDQHLMDAPDTLPSGSMESWTSSAFPIVQGVASRE